MDLARVEHLKDEHLVATVMKLPERLRDVFLLHQYQSLSYKEIGVALDIPLGTVKSRMNAALGSLRGDLRDLMEEER